MTAKLLEVLFLLPSLSLDIAYTHTRIYIHTYTLLELLFQTIKPHAL